MKKKILAVTLTLAMAMNFCAFSVSAQNLTSGAQSGSVQLTTNVEVDYIVTIPESTSIPFGALSTNIGNVQASKLVLEAGSMLTVTATPDAGGLSGTGGSIPYTCSFTTQEITDSTAYPVSIDITQASWDAAKAGSYSGVINFGIVYTPPINP